MADFKTQSAASDSLKQLMQLMQYSQQRKITKQKNYTSMQEELGEGIEGIYDNNVLAQRRQHFDRYYGDNKDDMDEDTLARFDLMKQKFDLQENANKDYYSGLDYAKQIGTDVENALMDYSDITEMSDSDVEKQWEESYPVGVAAAAAGNKTTADKRNDLRAIKMGTVKNLTEAYSDFSGEYRASHGERLGTRGFRKDADYINNLNEMFEFGIIQAEDDYILDPKESAALQAGVQRGTLEPILSYQDNERKLNTSIINKQVRELETLYQNVDTIQNIDNAANNFFDMDEGEEKEAMRTQPWYNDGKKINLMYGDLETDYGLGVWDELLRTKSETISKFNKIDESFEKRQGISYLGTTEEIPDYMKEMFRPKKITPEELNLAQQYINEGKAPDANVNMDAYRSLGGNLRQTIGSLTKEGTEGEIAKKDTYKGSEHGWSVPKSLTAAGLGAYAIAPDRATAYSMMAKDALIDASKSFSKMWGTSVEDLEKFWQNNQAQKTFEKMDFYDEKIKKVEKNSNQWKQLRRERQAYINRTAKAWASGKNPDFANFNWDEKTWEQVIKKRNGQDGYNFFRFKKTLKNKINPTMFAKIFEGKGKLFKTATIGVGSRVAPFAVGQTIAEELGADRSTQALAGAASAGALPQVAKRVGPKLAKMLKTEAGKKALKQFLIKQTSKKVAAGLISGGGVASIITGMVGTGIAVRDIYRFIRNYEEE
tara:strand:- start:3953 stop:6088 length:2136 start_codon:yes stop_codon:yes gene_type:complete